MTAIGEKIRKNRKANKLTQSELGDKVGVNQQTIAKWENGAVLPPNDRISLLSEALGVPLVEFRPFADPVDYALLMGENSRLVSEVASLREVIKAKDELIEALRDKK